MARRRDIEHDRVFNEGETAFERGEFEVAASLWESLGDDPYATFNAGNARREAGDASRAIEHLASAANRGVARAHMNLAFLLEDAGDDASAVRELERGSEAGDAGASVELAVLPRDVG